MFVLLYERVRNKKLLLIQNIIKIYLEREEQKKWFLIYTQKHRKTLNIPNEMEVTKI